MKLLKEFAEVPGAIILMLVALLQTSLGSVSARGALKAQIFTLEDQLFDVCDRIYQLELTAGFDPHACSKIPYREPETGGGHFSFEFVDRVVSTIELYGILVGIALFFIGIVFRFHAR